MKWLVPGLRAPAKKIAIKNNNVAYYFFKRGKKIKIAAPKKKF